MTDLRFTVPALPVLLPLAALLLLIGWLRLRRTGRTTGYNLLALAAGAVYAAGVLGVTHFPMDVTIGQYANQTPWYSAVNPVPLLLLEPTSFVLNIVMFFPLGVLLPLLTAVGRPRRVAVIALALSLAIELSQILAKSLLSAGRSADVDDLLANTSGALLGLAVVTVASRTELLGPLLRRLAVPGSAVAAAQPARKAETVVRNAVGSSTQGK